METAVKSKILTKQEVSQNNTLMRLGNMRGLLLHIGYDHEATGHLSDEQQESLDRIKEAIKDATVLFGNNGMFIK